MPAHTRWCKESCGFWGARSSHAEKRGRCRGRAQPALPLLRLFRPQRDLGLDAGRALHRDPRSEQRHRTQSNGCEEEGGRIQCVRPMEYRCNETSQEGGRDNAPHDSVPDPPDAAPEHQAQD